MLARIDFSNKLSRSTIILATACTCYVTDVFLLLLSIINLDDSLSYNLMMLDCFRPDTKFNEELTTAEIDKFFPSNSCFLIHRDRFYPVILRGAMVAIGVCLVYRVKARRGWGNDPTPSS